MEDPIFFSCNPNSLLSSHFKMKILSYKIYNLKKKKTYDPNSSREKHLLHNWLKFLYDINIIDYTNNLPFLVVRQKRINNRSWESWVFQDNFRRTLFLLVRIQIYFFFYLILGWKIYLIKFNFSLKNFSPNSSLTYTYFTTFISKLLQFNYTLNLSH